MMTKNSVQIVKEYIEQIVNQRRFDRLMDYCTEECVLHATPYVGLGVVFDDASGEKLVLTQTAPGGPAATHLQTGDELLRVQDGEHVWETFDDLMDKSNKQGTNRRVAIASQKSIFENA